MTDDTTRPEGEPFPPLVRRFLAEQTPGFEDADGVPRDAEMRAALAWIDARIGPAAPAAMADALRSCVGALEALCRRSASGIEHDSKVVAAECVIAAARAALAGQLQEQTAEPGGRITLTSGEPVPASDAHVPAEVLTPPAMWDGTRWRLVEPTAGQPQEPSVADAMLRVRREVRDDPAYAWSWQCNVAMAAYDAGCDHETANRGAARFMRTLFGVDVTQFPEWQGFAAQWAELPQEPAREPSDDTRRLDWIERQSLDDLSFEAVQDRPHDGEYEVSWRPTRGAQRYAYGKTLRAAIDAAMQAEGDGQC